MNSDCLGLVIYFFTLTNKMVTLTLLFVLPVKALIEDQVHYVNELGPEDRPPSTFGLFANSDAML